MDQQRNKINQADYRSLHKMMLKSRLFEEAVLKLWNEGKISGEMHLGIGEEAISAGVIDNLEAGDSMAIDHRGTPQLIMRGVDMLSLLKELLGQKDGLCSGFGGHMHLFSKELLIASSGIVGASAPTALGFAISATYLRPGKIAVAFFGEGAVNQGMVMETFNMAAAWNLPILFVCKDNSWSITTPSDSVTSGTLIERARSFGIAANELDGSDISEVWAKTRNAVQALRNGKPPQFLHMHCVRPEGHFLGDPLIRITRNPLKEMKKIAGPLMKSVLNFKGSSITERSASLGKVTSSLSKTLKTQLSRGNDPIEISRNRLKSEPDKLIQMEFEIQKEIDNTVILALESQN